MSEPADSPIDGGKEALGQQLVDLINQLLSDAIDLHMQAKRTRWQLTDPKLEPFRSVCDQVAEEIDEEIQELVNWAARLVDAFPELTFKKKDSANGASPTTHRTQTDYLKALAQSLKALTKECLDSAVVAKNLGDRTAGNAFAHIARVPSRLGKELAGQLESIESNEKCEVTALSIWVSEGGHMIVSTQADRL